MSITENINRIGSFTSSNISKLMTNGKGANGFGAPAITYIKETNLERLLGRSLELNATSKPMSWGLFLESRVCDLLEFGYLLESQKTETHPTINFWAGSSDVIIAGKKIGDIKCFEPKNFANYSDVLLKQSVELLKEEYPKEYWQLVSNAIINKVPNAEAICYMPYQSELAEIREAASLYDGTDQYKYEFIFNSPDASLAYLPDGGYYKNLNRFEFEVPKEDIKALTARVLLAGTFLVEKP